MVLVPAVMVPGLKVPAPATKLVMAGPALTVSVAALLITGVPKPFETVTV